MALRAFPVLYAADVETVAAFYARLGFEERVRMPGPDGHAGYVGLGRDAAELAMTRQTCHGASASRSSPIRKGTS